MCTAAAPAASVVVTEIGASHATLRYQPPPTSPAGKPRRTRRSSLRCTCAACMHAQLATDSAVGQAGDRLHQLLHIFSMKLHCRHQLVDSLHLLQLCCRRLEHLLLRTRLPWPRMRTAAFLLALGSFVTGNLAVEAFYRSVPLLHSSESLADKSCWRAGVPILLLVRQRLLEPGLLLFRAPAALIDRRSNMHKCGH